MNARYVSIYSYCLTVHVVLVSDIVDTYWATDKEKTQYLEEEKNGASRLIFAVPSHVSRISETTLT